MKTIHKTGDGVSGLCMNGSVLKSANSPPTATEAGIMSNEI